MPTYEYKCNTCGKVFEFKQSIKDKPLSLCPAEICEEDPKGKGEVERQISKNIGLVFNGAGFYVTDYVHNSSSPAASKSKSTESK